MWQADASSLGPSFTIRSFLRKRESVMCQDDHRSFASIGFLSISFGCGGASTRTFCEAEMWPPGGPDRKAHKTLQTISGLSQTHEVCLWSHTVMPATA